MNNIHTTISCVLKNYDNVKQLFNLTTPSNSIFSSELYVMCAYRGAHTSLYWLSYIWSSYMADSFKELLSP